MVFTLQNDALKIQVDDVGAELISAVDVRRGKEWLWQGDGRSKVAKAPVVFPYYGRLWNNVLLAEEKEYPAPVNGFAQQMNFACVEQEADTLIFRLCDSAQTRDYFPYPFELNVLFELFGNELKQSIIVKNPGVAFSLDEHLLPFNTGFHPTFAMDESTTTFDQSILFDDEETPTELYLSEGYMTGTSRTPFKDKKFMPLRDAMFQNGSLCLTDLISDELTFANVKTGRLAQIHIADSRYVFFDGPRRGPLPYLTIAQTDGLPDSDERYGEFVNKPGAVILNAGESYTASTTYTFF